MPVNAININQFLSGNSNTSYNDFGAFLIRNNEGEIVATRFTVYAPHAKEVRLVCELNNFEGWKHVLEKISHEGIFSIEIPENLEWMMYKYEIHLYNGDVLTKADPFAKYSELRPGHASKVCDIENYKWHDEKWFNNKKPPYSEPLIIYELHLSSWRQEAGEFKPFNEIVLDIISHVKYNGFTHIELMPVYEYPLDDSWGYQGTGFFSTTARYGSPKGLMYMIDELHKAGIGVIMDLVIGHINKDAHSMSYFDGTPLYEFENKHYRENKIWGTNNLDFSKGITRSFMLSVMNYWKEMFHIDGFRIDAVSNLIYYLGNESEGVNNDAINFFKIMSKMLFKDDDTFLLMAEDSTSYPKVTHPVNHGGLGFNYKWNMGFMNDTLSYFKEDPINRKYHHNKITFGLTYAFNENFVLPFSHDEVVHMKGSLLSRMPGDTFQQFANYRLLMGLWITHPGKKLLFMGQEFAQRSEWDFKNELDWFLYNDPMHNSANIYFKELVNIYRKHDALYQYDHDSKGFEWLVVDDNMQSVFAYERISDNERLVIVLNMTPTVHNKYKVGVSIKGSYYEILNSDMELYGGSNIYNGTTIKSRVGSYNNKEQYIEVLLAPLSITILKLK